MSVRTEVRSPRVLWFVLGDFVPAIGAAYLSRKRLPPRFRERDLW